MAHFDASISLFIIATCLASSVISAPMAEADTQTTTSINDNSQFSSTELQTPPPSTTTPPETSKASSKSEPEAESTTELLEFTSNQDTSTFTCSGKVTGYYADVKLGCRVYHFCTQMEGIEGTTYQRMSYICLEGSLFDQRDLNCVKKADLKVPCDKAEGEYERSNKQFDAKEGSQPSMTDNLAANIMMNPLTRFIAGR